jgi:hypothetical protein
MSIWPAATFMSWLSETYAPVATQRLGGSVYAAFWVAAEHQPQVDDAVTTAMLARANAAGFYPVFFDNEPAARAWLLEQQAQDGLATRP